ncbi:hypothetical protein DSO57_1010401 [Entomophthora muscae]|uniref:Uncharacterized protein n=1 Tax=Entomophthora muscae TaxID=34485 RepID=A0ACC2RL97_9FUNG|nr:hypothetical protein DSO57_1010401 [Entomophthora muscae]
MKSSTLITLGVVAASLNNQTSQSATTVAREQTPASTQSSGDSLTADDIDQVKSVLRNKKLMRRAAMIYRDPCPDCTIL